MMSVLTAFELLNTQSAAAAEAEAGAGDLWGVSLGTTTKAVAVGSILVVQATKTDGSTSPTRCGSGSYVCHVLRSWQDGRSIGLWHQHSPRTTH